jgi:hypothetical protein
MQDEFPVNIALFGQSDNTLPHYVINGAIFENKVIAQKIRVLIFSK